MVSLEQYVINFLQIYFFSGYNVLNTIIYSLIVFLAIYFIIKALQDYEINPIDLFIPLIPFIFLGASTRALVDHGIYSYNWFLVTPGISLVIGILVGITILFGMFLERKTSFDFKYTLFIIGTIIASKNILLITEIELFPILFIVSIWSCMTLILFIFGKYWSLLSDKINLAVISAHILDASSTFVSVDFYGYGEQHILPNIIFQSTNTAIIMFPLKIIVILICLYLIDKYIEDKTISGTFKLAIFGLGLLIGLRNILTLSI